MSPFVAPLPGGFVGNQIRRNVVPTASQTTAPAQSPAKATSEIDTTDNRGQLVGSTNLPNVTVRDDGKILVSDRVIGDIDGNFTGGGGGSFNEGYAQDRIAYVAGLREAVKKGSITLSDYSSMADQKLREAFDHGSKLLTQGSKAADAAKNGIFPLFEDVAVISGGQFDGIKIPFTQREMERLPDNVLPTSDELNGIFRGLLPSDFRVRADAQAETPVTGLPQVRGDVPPGTNLQEEPFVLPQQPGSGITNVNPPQELPPDVGIGSLIGDPLRQQEFLTEAQRTIEDFGRRQEEQLRQTFQVQEEQRSSRLDELSNFLSGAQERRYAEAVPGIQEQLNTQGLLRSSALGDALAGDRSRLEELTQESLLQQGLADREASILGVEQTIAPRLSAQTAGLERRLSLEDMTMEQALARELAAAGQPYVTQQRNPTGLQTGLQGALGGAAAGSAFGPWGSLIGALGGGTLGATSGGK